MSASNMPVAVADVDTRITRLMNLHSQHLRRNAVEDRRITARHTRSKDRRCVECSPSFLTDL